MNIKITDRKNGEEIMTVRIPYSQNPIEAVLNWCVNMGYRMVDIEWEGV